ncbi:MAG: cache domain-containing protein [Candidatus Marinarcus sp.]|uniref:sensor histidine kinase n=1 Tax=Candidatus Marinarcus sp. TaxID=3100987 RepID=UPI003B00920C
MKIRKDERNILKFLKFSPPIITLSFSVLVIGTIYLINQYNFNKEIKNLKKELTLQNKNLIKEEVLRVYDYIQYQKEDTQRLLKQNIKENVQIASNIISNITQSNIDPKITKNLIKKSLKTLKFNSEMGYFFIISKSGKIILQPNFPELENTNVFKLKNTDEKYFLTKMVLMMQKTDETFFEWNWYKPHSSIKEKKIGYLKNLEGTDWFIGSGYYYDDFKEHVKTDILHFTSNIKFGKKGFIFILDDTGTVLLHSNKSFIGRNDLYIQNKFGEYFIQDMINIAKKGEGFITYSTADTSSIEATKTSFVKGVNDWGFLLGAGFFEEDLNSKVAYKKKILNDANNKYIFNLMMISISMTVILTFISLYVSHIIQNIFLKYKNKISKEVKKNQQKDVLLAQQSKMAAMGEMIGNIAHQWRQPLSTITTAASGIHLKHEFGTLNDEEFLAFTKIINENAQYLSHTINDFKEFFNPHKIKETFTIEDAIDKTLNIVSAQFNSHAITVIKNIAHIEILGLKNELMQVIINILNNARDALEEEKIEKKLILIDVYSKNHSLYISIHDNAKGIKQENIARIFEPYFSTKFKSKGIGIGLYMSYEIITKHMNGTIVVHNNHFTYENEDFLGAQFIISIPLDKDQKKQ